MTLDEIRAEIINEIMETEPEDDNTFLSNRYSLEGICSTR